MNKLSSLFHCFALIISLALPQSFVSMTFGLIVIALFLYVLDVKSTFKLNYQTLIFTLILIIFFSYGILLSAINGFVDNDVFLVNLKLFFLYPLFLMLYSSCSHNMITKNQFFWVIIISSILCIILNGWLFLIYFFDFIAIPNYLKEVGFFELTPYHDRFVLSSLNITSSAFLLPLLLYFLNYEKNGLRRFFLWLIIIFTVLLLIFGGRRGLWIMLVFIPIYLTYQRIGLKWTIILSVFAFFIFISIWPLIENILNIDQNDPRQNQAKIFFDHFLKFPLGTGFGTTAFDFRSQKEEWLFELTWHKLLVDLGVIFPILVMASIVLWRYKIKSKFESFIFLTFLCNILISFTNPYFLNFDVLFLTFFLFSCITSPLRERFY